MATISVNAPAFGWERNWSVGPAALYLKKAEDISELFSLKFGNRLDSKLYYCNMGQGDRSDDFTPLIDAGFTFFSAYSQLDLESSNIDVENGIPVRNVAYAVAGEWLLGEPPLEKEAPVPSDTKPEEAEIIGYVAIMPPGGKKLTRVRVCTSLEGGKPLPSGWAVTPEGELVLIVESVFADSIQKLGFYYGLVLPLNDACINAIAVSNGDSNTQEELVRMIEDLQGRVAGLQSSIPVKEISTLPSAVTRVYDLLSSVASEMIDAKKISSLEELITECLSDHDQLVELNNRVLSRISSSDSVSIESLIQKVEAHLSSLRSYDDDLRDLLTKMSGSLNETYNDILAKASDVALKDVSISGAVSTLSDSLEKLGSLRSLAEKSDSALDSLVTLLPTLKSIEAGITQNAQSVKDSCLRLTEANGKVEACAEQALAATVSSNNTLSAIKDVSVKKDAALVTMTALTALASIVSSVTTIQKAKENKRCL